TYVKKLATLAQTVHSQLRPAENFPEECKPEKVTEDESTTAAPEEKGRLTFNEILELETLTRRDFEMAVRNISELEGRDITVTTESTKTNTSYTLIHSLGVQPVPKDTVSFGKLIAEKLKENMEDIRAAKRRRRRCGQCMWDAYEPDVKITF